MIGNLKSVNFAMNLIVRVEFSSIGVPLSPPFSYEFLHPIGFLFADVFVAIIPSKELSIAMEIMLSSDL